MEANGRGDSTPSKGEKGRGEECRGRVPDGARGGQTAALLQSLADVLQQPPRPGPLAKHKPTGVVGEGGGSVVRWGGGPEIQSMRNPTFPSVTNMVDEENKLGGVLGLEISLLGENPLSSALAVWKGPGPASPRDPRGCATGGKNRPGRGERGRGSVSSPCGAYTSLIICQYSGRKFVWFENAKIIWLEG